MLKNPPEFLIIGAARSGTSALASYLDQHPQLRFSRPKETHFFAFANMKVDFRGPGDDSLMNRCVITSPTDFDVLMGDAAGGVKRGEGAVSTLYYHQRSIANIKAYAPEAKLIALLRHPVDRAYSSYQYMRSKGLEPCDRFADALDQEQSRIDGDWHHIWHYTRMGFYRESIAAFSEHFAAEKIRIVFYDDFAMDAASVVRDLFHFLEVDEHFEAQTDLQINRSGVARSNLIGGAVNRVGRSAVLRTVAKTLLPFGARERIRNFVFKSSDALDKEIQARLLEIYRKDLHELGAMLQLPPSWAAV